jgi:hypothetical protein
MRHPADCVVVGGSKRRSATAFPHTCRTYVLPSFVRLRRKAKITGFARIKLGPRRLKIFEAAPLLGELVKDDRKLAWRADHDAGSPTLTLTFRHLPRALCDSSTAKSPSSNGALRRVSKCASGCSTIPATAAKPNFDVEHQAYFWSLAASLLLSQRIKTRAPI